jgi:hypothetical protein
MASAIDPTLPITGLPTTQSVRSNFQIAHDEITALQAAIASGPFLPLVGGEVSGFLQVDGPFRLGATVDAGFKLDVVGTARVSGLITALGGLTVTGASLIVGSNTTAQQVWVNGPAGFGRSVRYLTAGSLRWNINVNSTAEAGANVGSDLDIVAFSDAGTALAPNPLIRLTRSTGGIALGGMVTATGGVSLGNVSAASVTDLSKHLAIASTTFGINQTASRLNIVVPTGAAVVPVVNGADVVSFGSTGMRVIGNAGFYNTAPIAKQTLTGAWAGNTAGKALSTALAALGLITDSTTA